METDFPSLPAPHSSNPSIPVRIRTMRMEDIDQVHAIDVLSFSMPWPAGSYRFEILENPNSICLVAETSLPGGQQQVVGMVVSWLIIDEAHIATIAVHPDYRGKGIGRKLLTAALQQAIQNKIVQATLEVRARNEVAQYMYRDFGFEVVGSRPRYYQDNNEDALIMTVTGLNQDYLEWLGEDALE